MYLLIFGLLISSILVFLVMWSAMYLSASITRCEGKKDDVISRIRTVSPEPFGLFIQTSPIFRLDHCQTGDQAN